MKKGNKKISGLILFVILLIQILAFNYSAMIYKSFADNHARLEESKVTINTTLITNTVREQQRNTLSSIKQSWMQILENHSGLSLVKQNDGFPEYHNEIEEIQFDATTMYKVSRESNTYDIFDKDTDKLLIVKAKPQWQINNINKILDMLVSPIKNFGNNGGIVVYDSNSGIILLDTTSTQRLRDGKPVSIFKDFENPQNKNIEDTTNTINNNFRLKKDSLVSSSIIYMFNEPTAMGNDAGDFDKYKLGDYKRQFVESSVLPYETLGFDGQPMQLTILSIVDEQDVTSSYKHAMSDLEDSISTNQILFGKTTFVLFGSIICTMIIMVIALFNSKNKICDEDE